MLIFWGFSTVDVVYSTYISQRVWIYHLVDYTICTFRIICVSDIACTGIMHSISSYVHWMETGADWIIPGDCLIPTQLAQQDT